MTEFMKGDRIKAGNAGSARCVALDYRTRRKHYVRTISEGVDE